MTDKIYYQEPYLKELECKIVSIEPQGNLFNIVLDKTIFYPEGGGQPSDSGKLESKSGVAKIESVHTINGEVVHQAKVEGTLNSGETVKALLDWNPRLRNMRVHSGGHLLHDSLMTIYPNLVPLKGGHGKKAFLEYDGEIDPNDKDKIELEVNKNIGENLSITTKEVDPEELKKESKFIPANIPSNKQLRMIKIGNFSGMPDGGVHVKSTKEIGKVWIANITKENGHSVIRYGVAN